MEAHAADETQVHEIIVVQPELMNRLDVIDSVRIVVHTQETQRQTSAQLSSLLQALGLEQVEQRTVDNVPNDFEVRFFHSIDRVAAVVIQEVLSLVFPNVMLRDFRHYRPSPHEKLIEVWL